MFCGFLRKRQPVESADFSNQNLREVPVDLYNHRRSLQRLYLSSNYLRAVPRNLQRLESLTELDLSENDILYLPPSIGQLHQLKVLNVSKNNLPNIPEAIQNCDELISFNVSGNPIGRVCEGVTHLKQLRHLYLNDCELDNIPPLIGRLSKLESLELRENHLTSLPESFGQLFKLERLDLGCNEFETLSPVIGSLESLSEFWIDLNLLISLPDEICLLNRLTFLELSENRLMDLPEAFGNLTLLCDLYLPENLLNELPDSFGKLCSLQTCQLNKNRLTELPDTLDGLQSLIDLNLSHNHIIEIPSSIGCLSSLNTLNIDENKLEYLPEEIGTCSSLKVLTVRNNKLKEVPSTISQINSLSIINVVGNQLSMLPAAVASMTNISAIWIAENQSRPLLEFQVKADPSTGDNWLTCVLFPQQGHEVPYEESQASSTSNLTEQDQSSQTTHEPHYSTVNFDPQCQDEVQKKPSSLLRDPTPYPKELHSKIRQWRASHDILEGDIDRQLVGGAYLRDQNELKKINRPRSLLKALTNPVQDESGPLEASNSRTSTLSPDLLMHLPTSDIAPPQRESSPESDGDENQTDHLYSSKSPTLFVPHSSPPDIVSNTEEVVINDNNNNNNNYTSNVPQRFPSVTKSDSATSGIASDLMTPTNLKPPSETSIHTSNYISMESGFQQESDHDVTAWYLSPTPSPHRPPPSNVSFLSKSDHEDYDHLDDISSIHHVTSPLPVISPTSSEPPSLRHSDASVLSPRMLPPDPPQSHCPVDLTSLPPILQTSYAPKLQSHHPSTATNHYSHYSPIDLLQRQAIHVRHRSDPDPIFTFPHPPVAHSNSVDNPHTNTHYHRSQSASSQTKRSLSHQRLISEREFAIEHTLQSRRQPEIVRSNDQFNMLPRTPNRSPRHYVSMDNFHNSRRPRAYTEDSQSSFTTTITATSDRDYPDASRMGYKYHNSQSSINDSGIEILKRGPLPFLRKSPSSSESSYSSLGAFEVTLKKNPTLGLGITGGKDGENALRPGDKGFYVYRVVENMPADRSGKINVGDKILKVNCIEVSGLTNDQLVRLLTSSESYVTFLFSREPSMTLL